MNNTDTAPQRPPVVQPPDPPGYQLLEPIGRGAMGVVYRARQLAADRLVAVKFIQRPSNASDDFSSRFEREARAVARIQHPNVVQLIDVGRVEDTPFFAMELLAGGALSDHLRGQPQDSRWSAVTMEAIANGVAAAHLNSVVHRDLKPSNILFTDSGVPKVTDFGLAKFLDSGSSETRSGSIMGSPCYMSPEQARGDARNVSPTSDVYSLGAIFYEMLTGRPPFRGATVPETLDLVCSATPIPPSHFRPGLDRRFDELCLLCLEKQPDRRPPSAATLAAHLRELSAASSVTDINLCIADRSNRVQRMRRTILICLPVFLAAMGLLVLAYCCGRYYERQHPSEPAARENQLSEVERIAASIAKDEAEAMSRAAAAQKLVDSDLRYWQEAQEGIIAALRSDRSASVRLATARALQKSKSTSKSIVEALRISRSAIDVDGNPAENSSDVIHEAGLAYEHHRRLLESTSQPKSDNPMPKENPSSP